MLAMCQDEFAYLKKVRSCWQSNVVFLANKPPIWKGAGISFLFFIFLKRTLVERMDQKALQYLLAHEYGHVFLSHNLCSVIWLIGAIFYLFSMFINYWPTMLLGFVLIIVAGCSFMRTAGEKAEFAADDFAAGVYGKDVVIHGLLWIGRETKSMDNELRLKRLRRMGWSE